MFSKTARKEHHNVVVERLRRLMKDNELDALITFKSENLTYVNALPSAFLSQSGVASLAMAIIPKSGDVIGICCDFEKPALEMEGAIEEWHDFPMWIYIDDQYKNKKTNKPKRTEFFELNSAIAVLEDRLKAANLHKARIGVETTFIQVPIWEGIKNALPETTFIDAGAVFTEARAIKTPYEIECLRHAAQVQEEVVFQTMREVQIGMTHAEILSKLKSRSLAAIGIDSIRFMFVSIGPLFAPCLSPYDVKVKNGDLIKYDGALTTREYGADWARTFIAGKPSPDQERANNALVKAHQGALDMMGPGVVPKDIFSKAMQTTRENGLPNFERGHIGHSIGLDKTIEEPPFLSGVSEEPLAPGMVFCVELPYYAHEFGSIMNEDIVVITENGKEFLTTKERRLHPIGE